jgi:hypothetical protein
MARPRHLLDEVVLRHIDGRASEPEADDEPFGLDLLTAVVEVQVDETFYYELLQPLVLHPRLVHQLDLLLQELDVAILELLVVDALFELLMHDLVGEPAEGRGEVRVAVEAEPEVALVEVEATRVDRELLDVDGLVEEQLLETVVELGLLEQLLELLLEVLHVDRLKLNPQVRHVPIQVLQIAVQRLGMVNHQRIGSKILDQLLGHLIVGHNHELLHDLLALDPFLEPDVDGQSLLVQLKNNLALVEHLARIATVSSIHSDLPQSLQLHLHLAHLIERQALLLLHLMPRSIPIDQILSLLIGKLSTTSHDRLFEPRGYDLSGFTYSEEDAESQPPALTLERQEVDQLGRHHVDGFVGKVD